MCYLFFTRKKQKEKKQQPFPPFSSQSPQKKNAPLTFFQALKCLNLKGSFCFFLSGAFFSRLLKRCK